MENFDQIFTLIANEGIGLNLDILETGLLNIIALLAILFFTGRDFLGSVLEERKTTIVQSVQDAEDRLNDCLLYTSPSPRDQRGSRMPSSA